MPASFMESRIINHPSPEYPKDAKRKHIQGTVIVHAIIGKDGTMTAASVVCGPAIFHDSALAAVKQWTYAPFYDVDGKPLAVETTITLGYRFGASPPPPAGGGSFVNGIQVVDLRTDSPELDGTRRVQPKFPKEAKKAGVTGSVEVEVLVGTDGKVQSVVAVTGPEELRKAAENAVRKYQYPGYAVGGVAKMVRTQETVTFPSP